MGHGVVLIPLFFLLRFLLLVAAFDGVAIVIGVGMGGATNRTINAAVARATIGEIMLFAIAGLLAFPNFHMTIIAERATDGSPNGYRIFLNG